MHPMIGTNKAPLNILLADTDYSQYLSLTQLLTAKNGFCAKILWCGERDQYRSAILTGIYHMVLMDYSAESLFILEQTIMQGCRTPVVMLADQSSDVLMIRSAKCGALGVLNRKHPEQYSLKYFLLCADMHRHHDKVEQVSDGMDVLSWSKYSSPPLPLVHQ
jgi:hypothetical protein